MKIYTKTGDDGTTALYGGKRVSKHNLRVAAYGTVDELNAYLGLLRDLVETEDIKLKLIDIQKSMFIIGSQLASTPKNKSKTPCIVQKDIELLEYDIDVMNKNLSAMTHFVLPGGHPTVSHCHIARSICRRAERKICKLSENEMVDETILKYINRLSDYLFVLSRFLSKLFNINEIKWIPNP